MGASRRFVICQSMLALALFALIGLAAARPAPQDPPPQPSSDSAFQVTLFGILATRADKTVDPKLSEVEPKLRQILPEFGFQRLAVKSRRLSAGQSIECDLGHGRSVEAQLLNPVDPDDGKLEIKFTIKVEGQKPFSTVVKTPPNQLVFCDRLLPNKDQLLIGLAAR
jgi:hypothetical protein